MNSPMDNSNLLDLAWRDITIRVRRAQEAQQCNHATIIRIRMLISPHKISVRIRTIAMRTRTCQIWLTESITSNMVKIPLRLWLSNRKNMASWLDQTKKISTGRCTRTSFHPIELDLARTQIRLVTSTASRPPMRTTNTLDINLLKLITINEPPKELCHKWPTHSGPRTMAMQANIQTTTQCYHIKMKWTVLTVLITMTTVRKRTLWMKNFHHLKRTIKDTYRSKSHKLRVIHLQVQWVDMIWKECYQGRKTRLILISITTEWVFRICTGNRKTRHLPRRAKSLSIMSIERQSFIVQRQRTNRIIIMPNFHSRLQDMIITRKDSHIHMLSLSRILIPFVRYRRKK